MVTTIFPPPPGPREGLLSPSCMEDYFVIEFPVCGGEIGSLTLYWFLSLTLQPRHYEYYAVTSVHTSNCHDVS